MFGGSSKLGRVGGAGRGGSKRLHSSYPPHPPPHRPPATAGGRLSVGGSAGPRNRKSDPGMVGAPPQLEETFNLVSGNNPLAFAMIIRLAPDLVEEIKRVEAQGGKARMKFDSNPNNSGGNIIDVGGKEFRFTWSREFGDLCDTYEERQSGEDGNGLLVESGCAWRKLNVQRILDESTKNHVKMRSEEAERKHKSRKAIVLEHGNPSMKSQIKALAAVEATTWRNYSKKKESALKKRKVEPPQVGAPPRSAYKSGLSSTTTTISRRSPSPLPSPPQQPGASPSPLGAVHISKSIDDVLPSKHKAASGSEKEIPTRTSSTVRETPGGKGNFGAKPKDLQSMLITLLMEKPGGMTLKALEKAVGDTIPNSMKKIEPIIKKIATFQAPGRYILKPGVDLESSKKPLPENGSSPEDNNHHQISAGEETRDQAPAPQANFEEIVSGDDLEEQVQLSSKVEEESNAFGKVDNQHTSPDILVDKKGSDNCERQAGSSSDSGSGSGSESESDSSDSGSDSGSHSRSRSRSPAGTGSGTSSDSESDASSNSKEGSDEDVDIMTSDDEKEPKHKMEASELVVPTLLPLRTPDDMSMQNGTDVKQDGNEFDAVEIEKDLHDDEQETEMAVTTTSVSNKGAGKPVQETKPCSSDYDELWERKNYIGSLFDERENAAKDSFGLEPPDSSERLSRGKLKRGSDVKLFDEKSDHTKRLKAENLTQAPSAGGRDVEMFESSHNLSPVGLTEDTSKGPPVEVINRSDREGNLDFGFQKGYNRANHGKSSLDLQQPGRRSFEQSSGSKPSEAVEKSDKHAENIGRGRKYTEKSYQVHDGNYIQKDESYRDTQIEDGHDNEKKVPRNLREGGNESRHSVPINFHCQKHGEMVSKFKESRQGTNSLMGTSPKDNHRFGQDKSPMVSGKDSKLQRELSDLELGELREPTLEEVPAKRQFERKSSFKRFEQKADISEDRNSDVIKGKPALKATMESGKPSPPFPNSGIPSSLEGSNRRRNPYDTSENPIRSHTRVVQSHPQHHLKQDHAEVGSQFSKFADVDSKFRNNEVGVSQGIDLEGRGESNKKEPISAPKQHDTKRGTVPLTTKESKRQASNSIEEMANGRRDSICADGNNTDQRRRDSSSDENSCSYSKYEKDEPELKGPIKNFSQYKEYVQEYRDKYDSYCSLNKILESYRNEFHRLGKDLEFAKSRDVDRYYNILGQLKESYQRCGTRHKRLKKIFVVLHEELENLKRRIKDFAYSYTKE
ncbi:dentin sialophosphoprotein [Quillaja saponaria]|uniref:Dentin sialophosphoprotein n=1 Tax=Quillaja saponaria TaxID=32244 RepID=A0AAD7LU62_QUISA|nr:dentin sialophosphoprotein [Quillaja saponaria]